MVIAIATLGIEPATLRKRLEKSGLATAVLAYEEGDVSPKLQIDSVRKRTNVKRVSTRIEPFRKTDDATEERRPCVPYSFRSRFTSCFHSRTTPERAQRCLTFWVRGAIFSVLLNPRVRRQCYALPMRRLTRDLRTVQPGCAFPLDVFRMSQPLCPASHVC